VGYNLNIYIVSNFYIIMATTYRVNKHPKKCLKTEKSLAGSLKKYVKKLSKEDILNDLKEKKHRN
jgi:hypothetical protein